MKSFASLSLAVIFVMALTSTPIRAQQHASRFTGYVRYKGAWFSIDYPVGWKVKQMSRSQTNVTGQDGRSTSDSARFTSSDGLAEFYVFSPQWSGDPKEAALEAALDAKREQFVSHHVESAPHVKQSDGRYLYNPVAN